MKRASGFTVTAFVVVVLVLAGIMVPAFREAYRKAFTPPATKPALPQAPPASNTRAKSFMEEYHPGAQFMTKDQVMKLKPRRWMYVRGFNIGSRDADGTSTGYAHDAGFFPVIEDTGERVKTIITENFEGVTKYRIISFPKQHMTTRYSQTASYHNCFDPPQPEVLALWIATRGYTKGKMVPYQGWVKDYCRTTYPLAR